MVGRVGGSKGSFHINVNLCIRDQPLHNLGSFGLRMRFIDDIENAVL